MLKKHDPSAVPPMVPLQMKHSSSASWREGEGNPELVAGLVDAEVRQDARHGVPGLVPDRDDDTPGHLDATHPQVPQAAGGELSVQVARADPPGVLRGLVGPAEDPVSGRQLSRLPSAPISAVIATR